MSRMDMHTLTFQSLNDAVDFVKTTKRNDPNKCSSTKKEDYNWDAGMNYTETLKHASGEKIWAEGVNKMMRAMDITDELAAKSMSPRVVNDLVGGAVNMGAYMTGHPRNMRRRTKAPAVDKPVLSIGVCLGIYWGVRAQERLNMGAALLSAVDQLERNGYRCEITALWRGGPTNDFNYSKYVNIEYVLKRPEERWNPGAMAFAFAHPAFQRRLTWRIAETQPQWRKAITHYCDHKNTEAMDKSLASDFDIYFNNVDRGMHGKIQTPKDAFKYVQETLNAQLARAKEAAE